MWHFALSFRHSWSVGTLSVWICAHRVCIIDHRYFLMLLKSVGICGTSTSPQRFGARPTVGGKSNIWNFILFKFFQS